MTRTASPWSERPRSAADEAQRRQVVDALDEMIDGLLDAGVGNENIIQVLIERVPIFGVDSGFEPAVIRNNMHAVAGSIEDYVKTLAELNL